MASVAQVTQVENNTLKLYCPCELRQRENYCSVKMTELGLILSGGYALSPNESIMVAYQKNAAG